MLDYMGGKKPLQIKSFLRLYQTLPQQTKQSPGFATLNLPVYLARRGTFHPHQIHTLQIHSPHPPQRWHNSPVPVTAETFAFILHQEVFKTCFLGINARFLVVNSYEPQMKNPVELLPRMQHCWGLAIEVIHFKVDFISKSIFKTFHSHFHRMLAPMKFPNLLTAFRMWIAESSVQSVLHQNIRIQRDHPRVAKVRIRSHQQCPDASGASGNPLEPGRVFQGTWNLENMCPWLPWH